MKKYIDIAFIYAIAALISGVFYREFTKINDFSGKTSLAFTHVHLFALGTLLFLIVGIFAIMTDVSEKKSFKRFMTIYNLGLPFVVAMMYMRGIIQVLEVELSKGASAAISGIAGLSHILMTVGLILLFFSLRKCNIKKNSF